MDAVRAMTYRDLAAIRRVLDKRAQQKPKPGAAPRARPPARSRIHRPQRPRRGKR